jgi:hypothetical protein
MRETVSGLSAPSVSAAALTSWLAFQAAISISPAE